MEFVKKHSMRGKRALATPPFDEITKKPDALARWAKARENSGLFVTPGAPVQAANSDVANYVAGAYPPQLVTDFLKGADPWVIAHAKASGGVVVTSETRHTDGISKIKIPSVCDHFNIKTITVFEMMKVLGVTLKL